MTDYIETPKPVFIPSEKVVHRVFIRTDKGWEHVKELAYSGLNATRVIHGAYIGMYIWVVTIERIRPIGVEE